MTPTSELCFFWRGDSSATIGFPVAFQAEKSVRKIILLVLAPQDRSPMMFPLASGKLTKSYWTWPSRNSGFTQLQNGGSFHINPHFPMVFPWVFPWFSIVFCMFPRWYIPIKWWKLSGSPTWQWNIYHGWRHPSFFLTSALRSVFFSSPNLAPLKNPFWRKCSSGSKWNLLTYVVT